MLTINSNEDFKILDYILRAELFHVLDNNEMAILEIQKVNNLKENEKNALDLKFCYFLKQFYEIMCSRHSRSKLSELNKEMENCVKNLKQLCIKGFNEFCENSKVQFEGKYDLETIENGVIANSFYIIQDYLSEIQKLCEQKSNDDWSKFVNNADQSEFMTPAKNLYFIFREFVYEPIKKVELENNDNYLRKFLQNKVKRYEERYRKWPQVPDRLTYFILNTIIIRLFSQHPKTFNNTSTVNYHFGRFIVYLTTRYQIQLHILSDKKTRKFNEVITESSDINEELLQCQKIFTFAKLMCQYLPLFNRKENREKIELLRALCILRRGYSHFLAGENREAFNDYTDLSKLIDQLKQQFVMSNEGYTKSLTSEYCTLLPPMLNCLRGELYRRDYSYPNAREYYSAALTEFHALTESRSKIKDNSYWKCFLDKSLARIKAQLNIGKIYLELGEFRNSLRSFLTALKHSLYLINKEEVKELNENLTKLIDYLMATRFDARINKCEVFLRIKVLANNFADKKVYKINKLESYDILFSDILNRVGLIIYILNLPSYPDNEGKIKTLSDLARNEIAYKLILFCLKLNPQNTLARFNQLLFKLSVASHPPSAEQINCLESNESLPKLEFDFEAGEIFERFIRRFSYAVLENLINKEAKKNNLDSEQEIAKELLQTLFTYAENFALKNAEIYKYLMRDRRIGQGRRQDPEAIYFHILKRWSSFTPCVPRPLAFNIKGGGYFIQHQNKGIVIDPGFDFIMNLYAEGFSIDDIDAIIITHDHIDHSDNFDSILTLLDFHQRIEKRKTIDLFLNAGCAHKFSYLLQNTSYNVNTLTKGTIGDLREKYNLEIEVKNVIHTELSTKEYCIGIKLKFFPDKPYQVFTIGIPSDTRFCKRFKDKDTYKPSSNYVIDEFLDCDILVLHVNSTPFKELKYFTGIEIEKEDGELTNILQKLDETSIKISEIEEKLKDYSIEFNDNEKETLNKQLQLFKRLHRISNQIKYSYWYDDPHNSPKDLLDKSPYNYDRSKVIEHLFSEELDLGDHLYLHGVLRSYEKYAAKIKEITENEQTMTNNSIKDHKFQRLIIISELREEMGSYKNKLAKYINKTYEHNKSYVKCMTGDIGMVIRCSHVETKRDNLILWKPKIEIRCSDCFNNNDASLDELYHIPDHIKEVCIRNEDEGIFYFCPEHDPESEYRLNMKNYEFAERVEKYDLFKEVKLN